ncbi:MAG: hypothetical protein ACK5BW_02010, partial [Flavobacteriia bacterium]
MRFFIYLFVIFFNANFLFAQNDLKDSFITISKNKAGIPLIIDVQLNDRLQLEVIASLETRSNKAPITIYNGKEVYQIAVKKQVGDTTVYGFPAQDAEWRIAYNKDFSDARGWWINYNKKTAVRYPIHLTNAFYEPTNEVTNYSVNMSGKWKVLFQPGTPNEEMLIGVFQQEMNGRIFGSFLSETGDYRYLHGNLADGKVHLQTYTGYWAFVVEAQLNGNNEMTGVFYSGGKSSTPFKATRDETVQLRNEAELTYLIKRDERVVLNNLIKLNGRKTNLDFSK